MSAILLALVPTSSSFGVVIVFIAISVQVQIRDCARCVSRFNLSSKTDKKTCKFGRVFL